MYGIVNFNVIVDSNSQLSFLPKHLLSTANINDQGYKLANYLRQNPIESSSMIFGLVPSAYANLAVQAVFTPESLAAKAAIAIGTTAIIEGGLYFATKEINKK